MAASASKVTRAASNRRRGDMRPPDRSDDRRSGGKNRAASRGQVDVVASGIVGNAVKKAAAQAPQRSAAPEGDLLARVAAAVERLAQGIRQRVRGERLGQE